MKVIPGIPFPVKNLLPILFNVKLKNYFLATLLGEAPGIIIMISIFSGLTNVIQSDKEINLNILFSPEVFFPLLALALMSLIANFVKKKYFKNKV